MNLETINSLLTENMKKIYSFCLNRVSNISEAEDLAGDICVEILRSWKNIRDEEYSYGFLWGVANNVYKRYLRKKNSRLASIGEPYAGFYTDSPETAFLEKEELSSLRRELSLLSKEYREATVLYYVYNQSCSDIAERLSISVEMVKYYLFKARKIMKEGMFMPRELGEKSYNPDIFKIDYWGSGPSDEYWQLFKRRLPGNILLAAYYEPLTMAELSLELGVSAPYLEDEVQILLDYDLIQFTGRGRYQTNIVIFTPEYENELARMPKDICFHMAERLSCFIIENETELRGINFWGSQFTKNRLYWSIANLALLHAFNLTAKREESPLLANGSHGYVYGFNRDYSMHKFQGIDNANTIDINPPRFTVVNYRILNNPLSWEHHWTYRKTIIDVMTRTPVREPESATELIRSGFITADDGVLKPNFHVYTVSQFQCVLGLLHPIILEIKEAMQQISTISAKILISHAPKSLKSKCEALSVQTSGMGAMADIMECMVERNALFIPGPNEIVSTYGIVDDSI